MKTIFLIAMLASSVGHASTCNQKIYDQLYAAVVKAHLIQSLNSLEQINEGSWTAQQESLVAEQSRPDFSILRDLCRGQRSTYEKCGRCDHE